MGDGEYRLASRTVYKEGGVPRLGGGVFASDLCVETSRIAAN
jgi:hypothetical protein